MLNPLEQLIHQVECDNQMCLKIYEQLVCALDESSKSYARHENVIAVYFLDILKFVTGSLLRQGEINKGKFYLAHKNNQIAALGTGGSSWPYYRYDELNCGALRDPISFGHDLSVKMGRPKTIGLLSLLSLFAAKEKKYISLSPKAISAERILLLMCHRIGFRLIKSSSSEKFGFPNFRSQLQLIESLIADLLCGADFRIRPSEMANTFSNHVLANCVEGKMPKFNFGELFLAGGGCEIINRLLSAAAIEQGVPVVNVFHGGSYGVQIKPSFNIGELYMCDHLVTYGERWENWSSAHFPTVHGYVNAKFYGGHFSSARKLYSGEKIRSPSKTARLMYVPTTLRGANARYGPFEDFEDVLYENWWQELRKIFGDQMIIKLHPKSRKKAAVREPTLRGSLERLVCNADTFIFDYVSTAFSLIAATEKPIIFLDTGLQNFDEKALDTIKRRTVYFNLKNGMPPNYSVICTKAAERSFSYDYPINHSGITLDKTSTEQLINCLKSVMYD